MPGKKSIYLVEDESHIQQLVKYNLEANGYSVSTFFSGEEMLSGVKQIFGYVYTGCKLPSIDGS